MVGLAEIGQVASILTALKEKTSVRGAPDFMEFFNSLDKVSDRYKEINEALDLLKKDYTKGDKIPRNLWPKKYVKEHRIHNPVSLQAKFRLETSIHDIWHKT